MTLPVSVAAFLGLTQGFADPEIHVIPAGYVGDVFIVFRAANGEEIRVEGNARLYNIPANGILLTQAEPNVGSSPAWKFFTATSSGERTPIPRISTSSVRDTPEHRANPSVEIFYPRRGRLRVQSMACDVAYDQYFVGTRSDLLTRDEAGAMRRIRDSLAKSYVCR